MEHLHSVEAARALLKKKQYEKASEKYWDAAIEKVNFLAAKQGVKLQSQRSINDFLAELNKEHPEMELPLLFAAANSLQINFYEDNLPHVFVETYAKQTELLIERFDSLLKAC